MPKPAKPKSDKERANSVKAGKSKNYITPPTPNSTKLAAREAGLKQFVAKTALSVKGTKLQMTKDHRLVSREVDIPVRYAYDQNRKQIITNPYFENKKDF